MAKKDEKKPDTPEESGIVPYDFSQEQDTGMENVHGDDLSIPFLMILQDLSPEIKKTHKDHMTKAIPGAVPGHIINSLTREILNPNIDTDSVLFVPCFYQKLFMEWKPRDAGGGIVGSHTDSTILTKCKKNDRGQDILPNGNLIATTAYFYGYYIRDGEPVRIIIGMTSTQLKKARQWLSMATSIRLQRPDGSKYNPPLFSHQYKLSVTPESNAQGSWYGWKITNAGIVNDPMLIDTGRSVVRDQKEGALRLGNGAPEPEEAEEV